MRKNYLAKAVNATACLSLSLLVACGGGGGTEEAAINTPIVRIAPVDIVQIGSSVTLDGRESTVPSTGTVTYRWTISKAPIGSAATIEQPTGALAAFVPDKAGTYEVTLTVTSDNGTSSAKESFETQPLSEDLDRTKTEWLISDTTSSLTGVKTTRIVAPALGGANFVIACNNLGARSYQIETDFITANGTIRYRVGHYPIRTELWLESQSSGYKLLTPSSFNIDLLKQLYKSDEFILDVNKFGSGTIRSEPRSAGFAAAIDQTRVACNWSESDFPRSNGWTAPLPDQAPATAKSPTYSTGSSPAGTAFTGQFGYQAWVDVNGYNKPQLLVRVGQDKQLCQGNAVASNHSFYVEQSGRRVEALPGFVFSLNCASKGPATLALQGDFDPSLPFVLKSYLFHYSTLEPGTPFGQVSF